MNAVDYLRELAPPALLRWHRRRSGRLLRFSAHHPSWASASKAANGYASAAILERVLTATRAVVSGQAAYEQDSVTFATPSEQFHIVATLLRAASTGGSLRVVDFGGSMGGTYRRCRPFLSTIAHIEWQVIEQSSFVEAARREFVTGELNFFTSVAELPSSSLRPVILASSVLQYVERPWEVLESLKPLRPTHFLLDRTPVSDSAEDVLCVQVVPDHIYRATYPCWIFARKPLLMRLERFGTVLAEIPCADGLHTTDGGLSFDFRGWIFAAEK